ncbi:hypothetical protein AA23498_0643 [Acetobacter nitrogenifigens DSM 23921 = NBRC 105050]|uniref:Uncharacterized protein n=1 Tax=Acetobacter nitrogenifigens DSM 23921 = NBRC 105050 TaxID=1120919 RepID=A0A511X892_9PROT|nr:hypothetical protein [Acetobacter nitrogenifigens]GBQ89525.1 hypothetical protein AA23498_0643 [Acetobacter nitrogenifigens DSM 23921 = NBRC 105050]GEN59166.1 hypothetical protein ANI02nite_10500 [Acetobacter nitrogenifigens DSM 23921 = NBRC 105050]
MTERRLGSSAGECERDEIPQAAEDIRWEAFWELLDLAAAECGLSVSGLAKAAGLDATALNPSKRFAPDGRRRWLRMDTVFRLLDIAEISLARFAEAMEQGAARGNVKPGAQTALPEYALLRATSFSHLAVTGLFDRAFLPAGRPRGSVVARRRLDASASPWGEIAAPITGCGPHDYAVRLNTVDYEPVFRDSSLLVIAPDAALHSGDRALLHGEGVVPRIVRIQILSADEATVVSLIGDVSETIDLSQRLVLHRIVAATL